MPDFQKIYDYITETPENTNPIILKEMIEKEYGNHVNFEKIYKYISGALNKVNPKILEQLIGASIIVPTYPARTLSAQDSSGTIIEVDVQKDTISSTTSLVINSSLSLQSVQDAYDRLGDERGTAICAVDIKFVDYGAEVQPSKVVTVTIINDAIASLPEFTLVKFNCHADGLSDDSTEMDVIENVYVSGSTATCEVSSLGVFGIIGSD